MGKHGFISANNALFMSVDLIGEKNQVILEYMISEPEPNSQGSYCKPSFVSGVLISRFLDQVLIRGVLYSYEACLNTLCYV